MPQKVIHYLGHFLYQCNTKHLIDQNPYATKKEIAQGVGITNATYFFKKMDTAFFKKYYTNNNFINS